MAEVPTIRMTLATRRVLDVLMALASGEDPPWGYRICEEADLGSGTVYPILERLEQASWIEGVREAGQPEGRPRRRFSTLTLTGVGRAGYAARRRTRSWGLRPFGRPA